MKDSIIIIGGSPFINSINLPRIDTDKFDVMAINRQPLNIKTKYLIAHDVDFRQAHSQEEVTKIKKQGLNPVFIAPKTEFIHETTGWKWQFDYINTDTNKKLLGFALYTCSSAVNFAYLKGYKNVYFVGVDLAENNMPFTHWHGVTNTLPVPDSCARRAKEYIYRYKKWLNIYQCNPSVASEWQVEYCPIYRLYSHQ